MVKPMKFFDWLGVIAFAAIAGVMLIKWHTRCEIWRECVARRASLVHCAEPRWAENSP